VFGEFNRGLGRFPSLSQAVTMIRWLNKGLALIKSIVIFDFEITEMISPLEKTRRHRGRVQLGRTSHWSLPAEYWRRRGGKRLIVRGHSVSRRA